MEPLRLALLIFGLIAILGLYAWERYRAACERRRAEYARIPVLDEPLLDSGRELLAEGELAEAAGLSGRRTGLEAPQLDSLKGISGKEQEELSLVAGEPQPLLLALTIMARKGRFTGPAILAAAEGLGLRHGERQMFHLPKPEREGGPLLSMANVLRPGTFDLPGMKELSTPGVVLFLSTEGEEAPTATEQLIATAQAMAKELGGELCDDRRERLSSTAVAELRERAREHARRWFAARRSSGLTTRL